MFLEKFLDEYFSVLLKFKALKRYKNMKKEIWNLKQIKSDGFLLFCLMQNNFIMYNIHQHRLMVCESEQSRTRSSQQIKWLKAQKGHIKS